ncbi:uncharacterized protein LOC110348690 [Heterocephalus glaber]|uniref:Uncharacterized protein LOC110348690 n=1 Tax=Heterocephalus glaber TaxID=10181 RepID=A0AAX6SRM5_HETGA|nr:uncharacterized protein LOC110348690 [Heterocephalus glaber]XP_021112061.1 uncharacterized protein LOC110348690 [Heterocephalus glaber]
MLQGRPGAAGSATAEATWCPLPRVLGTLPWIQPSWRVAGPGWLLRGTFLPQPGPSQCSPAPQARSSRLPPGSQAACLGPSGCWGGHGGGLRVARVPQVSWSPWPAGCCLRREGGQGHGRATTAPQGVRNGAAEPAPHPVSPAELTAQTKNNGRFSRKQRLCNTLSPAAHPHHRVLSHTRPSVWSLLAQACDPLHAHGSPVQQGVAQRWPGPADATTHHSPCPATVPRGHDGHVLRPMLCPPPLLCSTASRGVLRTLVPSVGCCPPRGLQCVLPGRRVSEARGLQSATQAGLWPPGRWCSLTTGAPCQPTLLALVARTSSQGCALPMELQSGAACSWGLGPAGWGLVTGSSRGSPSPQQSCAPCTTAQARVLPVSRVPLGFESFSLPEIVLPPATSRKCMLGLKTECPPKPHVPEVGLWGEAKSWVREAG